MAEANGNGTARVGLWVSITGAVVAVLIFIGSLMTMYAQLVATERTADDLKERVDRMAVQFNDTRSQLTTVCADLKEIETQFRATDQVRNLMHANDLRIQSLLWQKVYAAPYPAENPYLPTIAQDQPTPCH